MLPSRIKRIAISSGGNHIKPISLQQAGFTILQRHRCKLWALTPLFSPLLELFKKQ